MCVCVCVCVCVEVGGGGLVGRSDWFARAANYVKDERPAVVAA